MGVTVESIRYKNRIDDLKQTGAATKFISFEPLLSSLGDLDLSVIDWAIVGANPVPALDRWKKIGFDRFVINSWVKTSNSFLSNGAAFLKNKKDDPSTEDYGTKFPALRIRRREICPSRLR